MFYNTETQQVYDSYLDVRVAFPNTCFPAEPNLDILASFNIVPLMEVKPNYNEITEIPQKGLPTFQDGNWYQTWTIAKKYQTLQDEQAAILAYMDILKQSKNEEINNARLEANTSGFTYNGFTFTTDTLSRSDIDATNGEINNREAFPDEWVGGWKAADNTWMPIATVEEWRAFYSAMYKTGVNNFKKAQMLKAQIAAITEPTMDSVAAIKAISW